MSFVSKLKQLNRKLNDFATSGKKQPQPQPQPQPRRATAEWTDAELGGLVGIAVLVGLTICFGVCGFVVGILLLCL
jgi:hypothetical protein